MSFQAVTWAIEQKTGSPRAKAVLWSLANYANEHWCAWPSQRLICEESEQSPDAVQKRLPELAERGLVRRIPLRFAGRKTVDFFILKPSRLFEASLDDIEPYLPRGCIIDPRHVAASSGSALPESDPTLPPTLPLDDGDAAALQRQQEPVMEPGNQGGGGGDARARTPLISAQAFEVAEGIATIAGYPDRNVWPPGWCGAPARVQVMLDAGWQPEIMLATARGIMAGKRDGPPLTIAYFERPFARAHALQAAPLPTVAITERKPEVIHAQAYAADRARPGPGGDWGARRDAFAAAHAELDAFCKSADEGGGAGGQPDAQVVPPAQRRGTS